MYTKYKYLMTVGNTTTEVHPIYKDDMALEYEHESGELFYRAKLSGNMNFVGAEANTIIQAPFETEFILVIQSSTDMGLTWSEFYVAKFYKTDCTINIDDLNVKVKPSVKDNYQAVLDGMEKEFNLIELLPVTEAVRMAKRAVIQIYGRGDDIITNFYGGTSWEQDYDISDSDPADFGFVKVNESIALTIDDAPAGMTGIFKGVANSDGTFKIYNGEGVYYIERQYSSLFDGWKAFIKRISNDEVVCQQDDFTGQELPVSYTFIIVNTTPYGILYATSINTGVYGRVLCDVPQITADGVTYNTQALRSDDPSRSETNYRYSFGYNLDNNVVQSTNTSTTPTKWGKKDDNTYYDVPDTDYTYYPVAQSLWATYSVWFRYQSYDYYIEAQARKTFYMNDAYPIWSVIKVLLAKVAPDITFEGNATYSEFLYGSSNPVSSDYNGVRMYITPKSNILVGEYTQPAMKAPITLRTVFDMLKNAFGCYWYIDSSNRLHVEHVKWFKNGGSYTAEHQISIDLTTLELPTNGKMWSFGTNEYQYDKIQMAARYQYKWMDDGTDVFDGMPYEIDSPFVTTDKVEEVNISDFTADVDYMMIAPENCSKDGFALLMTKNDGENYLPIEMRGTAGNIIVVQNWFGTLTVLQELFLNWDMPAWSYKQNDVSYTANGIQRNKKQQVAVPIGNAGVDAMKLMRTGIGDGTVEKASLNMSSRMAKITLKFQTYEND